MEIEIKNAPRRKPVFFNPPNFGALNFIRKFGLYGTWNEFGEVIIEKFRPDVLDRRSEAIKAILFKHYRDVGVFKDKPEELIEFLDAHFGLVAPHDRLLPHIMDLLGKNRGPSE